MFPQTEKMTVFKKKLSNGDYRRLHEEGGLEILEPSKNVEGQKMAEAIFMKLERRIPTRHEVKDFQKRETKGHSCSITKEYRSVFGDISPERAIQDIKRELMNDAHTQSNTLSNYTYLSYANCVTYLSREIDHILPGDVLYSRAN